MTKIIQKVNAVKMEPPRKRKVAAYARISIEKGRTPHSLSAQISYYSKLIQGNADWEYAGVYADKAVSGLTTDRPEFQRMLSDARDGKIDIILTKSISRFARNTVDLLETVRELKDLGIEVRFQKEKIHTLSEDGELMLSLLASFAQEESRSISENVKWGIRKNFQKGIGNSFHIYGYRWTGKEFVIVEEEAKIVRLIYDNYLKGIERSIMRLKTLKELFEERVADDGPHSPVVSDVARKVAISRQVFIVHGRDENAARESVARYLSKLELRPIILHEQPNQSRTIIEKFEAHADTAAYAVVLFTPDDIGYPANNTEDQRSRVRQNVLLELGFFLGTLGRKRVCVLYKEDVEIPSDYAGVLYVPLDDAGSWRLILAREMRSAGISIDLNKAL